MELHIKDIVTINIKASAKEHRNIIPDLLEALDLTLQPHIFGLERELLLKHSEAHDSPLFLFGDHSANIEDVLQQ